MFKEKSFLNLVILHLIAVLFAIVNLCDIKISGLCKVVPLFDLMVVFYFAVFRQTFGIWFIFILGLWNDALNGNPLGTTSLCYILLVKLFCLLNKRLVIKENFIQVWKQFVAFCFLFLLVKWTMLSLFNQAGYDFKTPLVQLVLSSCFYVVMHRFFDNLSQKLLGDH
jgi:rod shape-determining protein MreD